MDRTEKSKDLVEPGSCPGCGRSENPPENRFCGHCGASLTQVGELVPRTEESRMTLKERILPDRLGPVGKTVAVSLAAAAANVSLAWLRRRLEKTDPPTLPHDTSRARRGDELGGNPEYLYSYFLKEAALLLREGREARGWFSSELTVRSNCAKGNDAASPRRAHGRRRFVALLSFVSRSSR